MNASTQGAVPPFAPAAPIGSDKIAVYAQRDVFKEVFKKDKEEPTLVLVHPRGHRQELESSIAREVVRNSPADYGFIPPGGVPESSAAGPEAESAAASRDRVAAILGDPEALRLLREAILTSSPVPPVGLVTDLGAPGGVASASTGSDQVAGTGAEAFQLTSLPGVNDKLARSMEDHGFGTLASLRGATVESLSTVPGMGEKLAKNVLAHVAEKHPTTKKEG